jgi:uncharacterized membrane protein YedE/YeeE
MTNLWTAFWPWWLSAAALAAIAVGFFVALRRTMGVSGSLARVAHVRDELAIAPESRELDSDPAAIEAALMAATIEAFGDSCEAILSSAEIAPPETRAESHVSRDLRSPLPGRLPWTAHAAFLAMIPLGAMLASIVRGTFRVQFDLGPEFTRMVTQSGPHTAIILLLAGVLVGFGTRMAGGCTSGHGLIGCARLHRGSLLATACFFGAGIAVSFFIAAVAR